MKDISTAVEALARFKLQFQALADLADALTELGSLQGAAQSAVAATDRAKEELAGVTAELADANREVDAALAKADQIEADADAKALKIIHAASTNATEIIDKANADAQAVAEASIAKYKGEIADLLASRDALGLEVAALTKLRNDEQDKRGQIEADVIELNTQLTQVRSAIAALKG